MAKGLRLEESFDAMGSTWAIILYGSARQDMNAALQAAVDEVRRIEEMLSPYRATSPWSEVNRHASQRPVKLSTELVRLLSDCLEYSRNTEGAFDISVGPLLRIWGFTKGTGRQPSPSEVAKTLSNVGYRHLIIDPDAKTIRFDRPGVEIDPGGIGKGYAVDQVVNLLKQRGFGAALVNGAGSTIYGLGAPPTEPEGWRIDICDPVDPRKIAAQMFLRNSSISTSGNLRKSFWADGRLYSHILDPRTGYPAQGMLSVSVVAPRASDGEAWTKPLFIHGRRWASGRKPKGFRAFYFPDTQDPW